MAVLRPFKAVRPREDMAARVAALPYDVMTSAQAREMVKGNPYSFLHVDRAEIDLDPSVDIYSEEVYEKAAANLQNLKEEGILIQDEKPCFYIYRQIRKGKAQTGIVGCASIDDYLENHIKKHELTRADKEADRIHHVDTCDANTGPIFLTCSMSQEMKNLTEQWTKQHKPVYDFVAEDEIAHIVWIVDDAAVIEKMGTLFDGIPAFYIADGHHRAASAVKVGQKRRAENPGYTGEEEFNFFLSVVFPYDELTILPYNRVVKDLNGLDEKAFVGSLKFNFELMLMPGFPCKPVEKHSIGMYTGGQWYHLRAWEDVYSGKNVQEQLDVAILQEKVLSPILGIGDPRTDNRISFVGGSHKAKELEEMADATGGVAFVMYPTSMEDLMQIADEGGLMPPKSTWFEPKLRSGLFIHELK